MFEKVSPYHPDIIADRIAGAMLDLAYSKQENPRDYINSVGGFEKFAEWGLIR